MREMRTCGFVRGVPGDWHPYRDSQPCCFEKPLSTGSYPKFDLPLGLWITAIEPFSLPMTAGGAKFSDPGFVRPLTHQTTPT